MDKVLIVDYEKKNLEKARQGFKDMHHFELLTASSVKMAIELLEKNRISVLATDVHMPGTDGLELIAYMTRKFPSTPIIVILDENDPKPWFSERDGHVGVLYYIEKPYSFGRLASAIFVGLNLRDEGLSHKGIMMKNFLPLVVILRRTCRMEVMLNSKKNGFLYFKDGKLLDAHSEFLTGEAAAKEMATWQGVQVTFSDLPPEYGKPMIKMDTMTIAKATWKTDTFSKTAKPSAAPAKPASKLEAALLKNIGILRTIKGYRGLAIVNAAGNILASDIVDQAVDFSLAAEALSDMYSHCSKVMLKKGFKRCNGLALHTPEGLLMMRTTDLYASGNYRFLCLMTEDGNGFFMQMQLKIIIPKILSGIS
ncbi:MAG: response regulator [Deltaproteobacteria bacterium]|nr:response regulator [Deltaproteobacteria bacterium]